VGDAVSCVCARRCLFSGGILLVCLQHVAVRDCVFLELVFGSWCLRVRQRKASIGSDGWHLELAGLVYADLLVDVVAILCVAKAKL
jgi:hypothetical protein